MVDSHNHIHFREFRKDLDEVLGRAVSAGLTAMLTVGIDPKDSKVAVAMASSNELVYASVGIHPQMASRFGPDDVYRLEGLCTPRTLAVGETGFDLYRSPQTRNEQEEIFKAHIVLAKRLGLPLVIHDRDAHDETVAVLDESEGWDAGGVFHCFSGDVELARKVVENGFLVSIPGVVTYHNADKLKEVVRDIPLEALLVETDAPYLAPVPMRGKRNEPSFVRHAVEEIARIKGVSAQDVARVTSDNFKRVFFKRTRGAEGDHERVHS